MIYITMIILIIILLYLCNYVDKIYPNGLKAQHDFKNNIIGITFIKDDKEIGELRADIYSESKRATITRFEFYENAKTHKGSGFGHTAVEQLKIMVIANTKLHSIQVYPYPEPGYNYTQKELRIIYQKLGFKHEKDGNYILEIPFKERIKIKLFLLLLDNNKHFKK